MSAAVSGEPVRAAGAGKPSKPRKAAQALAVTNGNGNGHALAVPADASGNAFAGRILELARDPNFDASKVTALWDVHQRYLEEQRRERDHAAKLAFFADKAKAQAEFPVMGRDAHNSQTNSRYARLESIWEECCPIWTKHGFSIEFPCVTTPDGLIRLSCRVTHAMGHEETTPAPDAPSDDKGNKGAVNKTVIQGNQSTMTYLKRGALCNAMGIVTKYEDDDGESGVRRPRDRGPDNHTQTTRPPDERSPPDDRPPPDNRRERPPANWVNATFTALDKATSKEQWTGTLVTALGNAPSATEVTQLAKRMKPVVDKLSDRELRNSVSKLFHDTMETFGGAKSDKKSDRSDTKSDSERKALSPDEQWAEDQISELSGVWSMDVFLVMANKPETQERMKRLSSSGPANHEIFDRVKAAYGNRQAFIAKEATR